MNRKGFTLIEVLVALIIISIIATITIKGTQSTMSASKEDAYKIMKTNIVSAATDYINECVSGTLECGFSFENDNTFTADVLKEYGFFSDLYSPVDGSYLGECLVISATHENGVLSVDLTDNCY